MMSTTRRDVTHFSCALVAPVTVGHWPVAPADATLIAWDGHREATMRCQTRLYRLGNGRFLIIERRSDPSEIQARYRGAAPDIVTYELSTDEALDLYARLRVTVASLES